MKTVEQFFQQEAGGGYPLRDILDILADSDIVEMVQAYAEAYFEEHKKPYALSCLQKAADNGKILVENYVVCTGPKITIDDITISVDKDSIVSEDNLI